MRLSLKNKHLIKKYLIKIFLSRICSVHYNSFLNIKNMYNMKPAVFKTVKSDVAVYVFYVPYLSDVLDARIAVAVMNSQLHKVVLHFKKVGLV